MKVQRQEKILEIIASKSIETQEQLLRELQAHGLGGTQATISRDIKELRIVKELTKDGTYRYAASRSEPVGTFSARLNTIFRECVTTCDSAQNLVVIRTLPGLASAAASAMDSTDIPNLVGTLAGDDTAFLLMEDTASAAAFCEEIREML